MGTSLSRGSSRLAGVAVVIFLANAGLLVLQLAAGRLLAPFLGSSLETWTAIIGSFLTGIALGNAYGGRLADRWPSRRLLALGLAAGALAAGWMIALPLLLESTGMHRNLGLSVRIPVLAALLCFPAGFVLSLLTPLAIRLGLPDVAHVGRVAGTIFAVGTCGSLVGNYVTGFVLVPAFTINTIVGGTVVALLLAALLTAWLLPGAVPKVEAAFPAKNAESMIDHPASLLTLRQAYAIVFLASFAGMTLELVAARMLAQVLGVSLYTWTGVIGVMLAGTAAGNWLGGRLADRAARFAPLADPRGQLATALVWAAALSGLALLLFIVGSSDPVENSRYAWALFHSDLPLRVFLWTFALFFLPMLALGTVSPQVIRLAVPDLAHAGRIAGRVYAWSTTGAIVGTFATGFVLISGMGAFRTLLLAALLAGLASMLVINVWKRPALLYTLSIVGGCTVGGMILLTRSSSSITRESNYYTIQVVTDRIDPMLKYLQLDLLLHSAVQLDDPTFLYYRHEEVQIEFLRVAAAQHKSPRALVIGGGGYTFPRVARMMVPESKIEVVEIDPGVTAVAYEHLALDPGLGIISYHMDGRQFVAERAEAGQYHLVTLDAVNDLSVPAHLLTVEFNEAVKRTLAPDGVYLLTVIDDLVKGRLWRAAVHTLRKSYSHVTLLSADYGFPEDSRSVYLIYASTVPFNLEQFQTQLVAEGIELPVVRALPVEDFERWLNLLPPVVLTDQYAPVDNMMSEVFRHRDE